eukprot:g5068.t1
MAAKIIPDAAGFSEVADDADVPDIKNVLSTANEVTSAITSEAKELVLALSESVPLFGTCVAWALRLTETSGRATANKKACAAAHEWSKVVTTTLVNAAPGLAKAEDPAGAIGDLLAQSSEAMKELVQLSDKYGSQAYIVQCITSKTFKTKFDKAKAKLSELLTKVSMTMQAVQLKLAAEAPKEIADMVSQTMQGIASTMTCKVELDEKLDSIIAAQHEMLQAERRVLEQQGQNNVQLEALLHVLADAVAPAAADRELVFTISGTFAQNILGDPTFATQGITTHAGAITPWLNVQAELTGAGVLSEAEWTWLGASVGAALNYDHGRVDTMMVLQIGPQLVATLTPLINAAVEHAAAALKLRERGVKLHFEGMDQGVTFNVRLKLNWPALGPTVKQEDIDGIVLPVVPPSTVKQQNTGDVMTAMQAQNQQSAGCCVIS